MEGFAHRRLPGEELSRGSLTAKEVNVKLAAGMGLFRVDGGEQNAHGSVPDFLVWIDACRGLDSRVPLRAVAMRLIEIDIEIEPFVLRRQLEFFVAANVLEV